MIAGIVSGQALSAAVPVIPTDGLIAHYKMDSDAGGILVDETGDHDGTISGATVVAGKIGNALSFDGVNDIASAPHSSALCPAVFSLSFWIKTTTTGNLVVAEKDGNDGWSCQTTDSSVVSAHGGSVGQLTIVSGGTFSILRSGVVVNDGNWHHVVAVIDYWTSSTSCMFYIDGVQTNPSIGTGSRVNGPPSYASGPLSIGQRPVDIGPFPGAIDQFRYYDRVLTSGEAASLYAEG